MLKRTLRITLIGVLVAAGLPALAAWADQAPPHPSAVNAAKIPAGSLLHIRLTTTLTSKTNKTGDPFTGEVTQPVTADGKEVIPAGSLVDGHVAFVKAPGRIKGKAEMRVVLDHVVTPDDIKYSLNAALDDGQAGPCAKTGTDEEGTIKGCGKSKKDAAKNAALGGAMGAGAGASVGMAHTIECDYYGACGGPGMGTDVLAGAGIGAGTVLIYTLFKKQKDVILIEGSDMTFVVNRTSSGEQAPPAAENVASGSQ